jgi:GDP-L-fucose synthase
VNLGSAFEISIPLKRIFDKDLVETITWYTGFAGQIVGDVSKPNGQPHRKLDTSRAKDCFGFLSQTLFEEGRRRPIEWYRGQISRS